MEKVDEVNFKVQIRQAPEKGKANRVVIRVLADYFGVSQSKINIVSGSTSRLKVIEIAK